MTEGEITYSFKCDGLELSLLEISLESESIPSVTMESIHEGVIKATFKTENIFNLAEARILTDQLIENLTYRLSYILNIAVKKPVFSGSALPPESDEENKGRHKLHATSVIGLDAIIHVVIKPGAEKRAEIVDFLRKPTMATDLLIAEFAFSISQREHLSKFMLLYNLILQIAGDSQKLLDDTIKKIDPSVATITTKRKTFNGSKEVEETIYTKLRNEIAHKRDGVTKQDTLKEIKSILPKFIEIVKKAVDAQKS